MMAIKQRTLRSDSSLIQNVNAAHVKRHMKTIDSRTGVYYSYYYIIMYCSSRLYSWRWTVFIPQRTVTVISRSKYHHLPSCVLSFSLRIPLVWMSYQNDIAVMVIFQKTNPSWDQWCINIVIDVFMFTLIDQLQRIRPKSK